MAGKRIFRSEFVTELAQKIKVEYPDLSKTKLEDIVDRALKGYDDLKRQHVEAGDTVIAQGWGKYYQTILAGRKGTNFQTGEATELPPVGVARFKSSFSIEKPPKELLKAKKAEQAASGN